jgi:4-hydroxy-3-methylbut-2-enyl diphosphate reductase
VGSNQDVTSPSWLPAGAVTVGLTAGASTPNNVVGDVVERILSMRGHTPEDLQPA